jgi:hypothetical protein
LFPPDAKSNNVPLSEIVKEAEKMSLHPIQYGLTRAVAFGILFIFPAVFLAFCSTVGRAGGPSVPVTASKSADSVNGKDKAANRRRWATRVQRDSQLDPGGSQPGYYGSFSGPRFSW